MANFTPPAAEFSPISSVSQFNSSNGFSNQVFGDPIVVEGTRKINHTCLFLNGTTDYINIVESQLYGTITVDLWVWFSFINNTEQVILSQVNGSSTGNISLSVKNQKLCLNNNNTDTNGTSNITPKVWNHIALVRNGTTCKVYLNGTLEIVYTSFVSPVRAPTQIGARSGANFLKGMIDVIRFRSEESWTSNFSVPTKEDYIGDEYWDNVSLLLKGESFTSNRDLYADKLAIQVGMDHYNNSVYMGPYDDSGLVYGPSFVGNAKIVSSHFKHNYPSISFDGINDSIVVTNSSDISFGTTFTFEFWAYFPNFSAKRTLFDKRESSSLTGALIYQDIDSKLYVKFGDSSAGWDVALTSGVLAVGWHYIAIVRNAADTNSWKLFVDGTQSGSTVNSAITVADNANLIIGRSRDSTEYFNGQLSEIQLTQTAKYTTSVTVPTAQVPEPFNSDYEQTSLLLHFDGADGATDFTDSSRWNHVISGSAGAKISTTQSKFGSSSLYLNGSAYCNLVINPHDSLFLTEGDFTIDFWARFDSIGASRAILGNWSQNVYGHFFLFQISSSNRIVFYWSPYLFANPLLTGAAVTIAATTWYHIAVTRNGNWFTLWTNGAIDAQIQIPTIDFKTGLPFRNDRWKSLGLGIGNYYDGTKFGTTTGYMTGYLDEIRVVKGKAMYTEPFTPSATAYSLSTNFPYRNTSNKMFIDVNSDYNIVDKSIACSELTFEGGIIAGKYPGGSYATFDGNGDAIRFTSNPPGDVAFGLDDFTVEAWVYPINGGYVAQAFGKIVESEQYLTTGGFNMAMSNAGTTNPCSVIFCDSKSGGFEFKSDTLTAIPNSAWSHVAFTRVNGILTSYLNGVPKQATRTDCPITTDRIGSGLTLSNNNKTVTHTGATAWVATVGSHYFNTQSAIGTYWEVVCTAVGTEQLYGVGNLNANVSSHVGFTSNSWGYYSVSGNKYNSAYSAYGSSYTTNDVIGVAVKNGKIWFSKNGVWQASGNPVTEANPAYSNLTGYMTSMFSNYTINSVYTIRTKSSEFSYPIPDGFVSIAEAAQPMLTKNRLSIGANNSALESFYGNIDDVRITRGQARYGIPWKEADLVGDPNSSSVVLLLNCDGADAGTSFIDSSTSGKTVTVNGTVTTITSDYRFATACGKFDGTSGYLSLADNADWNYGSGEFCIEFWYKFKTPPYTAYTDSTGAFFLYSQRADANNYLDIIASKTGWTAIAYNGGVNTITLSGTCDHDSLWHHFAFNRVGTTAGIFIDGVNIASVTNSNSFPDVAASLLIGKWSGGSSGFFKGNIDDYRITKGAGRYPTQFGYSNPPTGLLPIKQKKIQDLPSFPTKPYAIRTSRGSGAKFDIAMDFTQPIITYNSATEATSYFQIPSYNLSMVPSTSDFTIEGWFYSPLSSDSMWFMTKDYQSLDGFSLSMSNGFIRFRSNNSMDTTASSLSLSGWNHVVFQRRGNLKQIFINGVKTAETTLEFDASAIDDIIYIGSTQATISSQRFIGFIDNLRYTRGIARYLTNFTPPTASFSKKFKSMVNTNLMISFSDTIPLDSRIKLIGTRKIVRPSGPTENGSCWFDGDDDYIQLSPAAVLLNDDFTLELWFELHQYGSNAKPIYIWSQGFSASQTDAVGIISVSSDLVWKFGSTFVVLDTVSLYTWNHVAITRESGLVKIYVNGVKKYEANIPQFGAGKSSLGLLGDESISASEYRFKGFINNFRIVKNVILYTEDFSPSTTLTVVDQSSFKTLIDTGSNLEVGNFLGSLDELTIFDGTPGGSLIKTLADSAKNYSYPLPRDVLSSKTTELMKSPSTGQWYGLGKIWGTVTDSGGQPMSRKVVLIEYWSYTPLAEVISDPDTGYYEFTFLNTDALFSVVAEDFKNYRFNDIIRAKIRAQIV